MAAENSANGRSSAASNGSFEPFGVAAALALILARARARASPTVADATPHPQPEKQTLLSASEQREHLRILAAYGGVYRDQRVQQMLDKTVDKLVAASERPDLKYEITILNSPAVNAFALPNGQLYVTRGLIALANDNSELASVLSHEMAHVIARHAAIREDQARQAALINRVATDLLSDRSLARSRWPNPRSRSPTSPRAQEFEADGIGVGISARAGYDPYGAERFLTSMGMNVATEGPSRQHRPARAGLPVVASGDAGARHQCGGQRAAVHRPGRRRPRQGRISRHARWLVYGEDPSEGFVRGRRFLHPKLGFTFTAPEGFTLDNTAQAVFGVKDGGAQALRLDVVRVPTEQTLPEYRTPAGSRTSTQKASRRSPSTASRRDRDRHRRPVDVPALCGAVRQRGLSRHLRGEEPDRGGRQDFPAIARHVPPHR